MRGEAERRTDAETRAEKTVPAAVGAENSLHSSSGAEKGEPVREQPGMRGVSVGKSVKDETVNLSDVERDERMMRLALQEADAAFRLGEVPIGAVVARGDEVIALAHNERETGRDATLHAECIAIRRACERLGGWRLPGCTLYVTLEPCPMCAGAAINARIERVVYGARDAKAGSVESLVRLYALPYNHIPGLTGGVLESECAARMTAFFERLRGKRSVKRMKKIDMHAHIPPYMPMTRPDGSRFPTADELRGIYDELGVDRGVTMGLNCPIHSCHPLTNYDGERVCQEHPETAGWWFCTIDPRIIPAISEEQLGFYLSQYKERGAKGIGEMVSEVAFDDPRAYALFRQAEKLSMPVTIHIGLCDNEYGLRDEPGLPKLERVLQDFPNLIIIGHSQRFWSEISGNVTDAERNIYPQGPVTPGGRVPELLRKYPNLRADLSAGSGFNAITRDPDFGYAFLEEFQNQLHFACDICELAPRPFFAFSQYRDDAVLANRISDRAYRAICRDNSLKLLGEM